MKSDWLERIILNRKKLEEGYAATRKLLQENFVPASELPRVKANMVHYEGKMKEINQQKSEWERNQKQASTVNDSEIKIKKYKKRKVRS